MRHWSFGRSNRANKLDVEHEQRVVDEFAAIAAEAGRLERARDLEYPVYEVEHFGCPEVGCEGPQGHHCPHYYIVSDSVGRWSAIPWGSQ
jgi:hypothetical protein